MTINHNKNLYLVERSDSYMCFSACLNMILRRRALRTYPQQQIAYSLGLKIPLSLKEKYPDAQVSDDEVQWGVHPNEYNLLERFIIDNQVDLYVKYIDLRKIPSDAIIDCIWDNLDNGNDIIVGYDYASVFGDGRNVGHVSLISALNDFGNTVLLIDPEEPQPVNVFIRKLIAGVYEMSSGFWIFSSSDENIFVNYI